MKTKKMKKKKTAAEPNIGSAFNENIEMDARMVLAGMQGGIDGIMSWGLMHRATFRTPNMITDRCEWLKKQSEQYIMAVSTRAAELERQ